VPSENVTTSEPDRRTRKRQARRDALLDLAADLVDRHGVDGVTMAALAEAADYAPASLYTYFPSRSALLAALQQRALATLARVARDHVDEWNRASSLLSPPPSRRVTDLARLWAFSDLFLTAPDRHPREFRLQQQLLVTPGAEETHDAASVVPAAMVVLDVPRGLLQDAAASGALEHGTAVTDPVGQLLEPTLVRTFAWVVAMNGALMVDSLTTGLPSTGRALGDELTAALLRGWGAPADELAAARELAHRWTESTTTAQEASPR
jgi:AcrR family transcriptional regulator